MTSPVSILNSEHYLWGDHCDGWFLLKRDEVSVIQERVPEGGEEVMHYHQFSRQFFYILEGQGSLVFEEESVMLKMGEGLEIPPGRPHQFKNPSGEEVRFLVISVPKSQGDRINL